MVRKLPENKSQGKTKLSWILPISYHRVTQIVHSLTIKKKNVACAWVWITRLLASVENQYLRLWSNSIHTCSSDMMLFNFTNSIVSLNTGIGGYLGCPLQVNMVPTLKYLIWGVNECQMLPPDIDSSDSIGLWGTVWCYLRCWHPRPSCW